MSRSGCCFLASASHCPPAQWHPDCAAPPLRNVAAPRPAADKGGEWSEGEVVTGVLYKAADGEEVVAKAHLTVGGKRGFSVQNARL